MRNGKMIAKLVATLATGAMVLTLAACAPHQAAPEELADTGSGDAASSASDDTAAVQVEWSLDSDCTMCHATESASMDDSACPASTHQAQGATCATCHNDEAALTQAHANAQAGAETPTHLSSSDVSQDACLTCHNMDDLAAATAEFDGLTDTQGTTVNPHALPDNADHAAEVSCSSCHKMHDGDSEPATEARRTCNDCHHEGVYECYTCHS